MEVYLGSITNVTAFDLQWRDWFYLAPTMEASPVFEDVLYQLKTVQRLSNPPSGNTVMQITNVPLGIILSLYHTVRFSMQNRNMANNMYNRFTTALNGIGGNYPEIVAYLAAAATHETTIENLIQDNGRKMLRGKYNV